MDILNSLLNMVQSRNRCSRKFLTFVIYMTTLLDNILLTVIVPILPDYLSQIDNETQLQDNLRLKNLYLHYVSKMFGENSLNFNQTKAADVHFDVAKDKLWNDSKLNEENGAVGILLATKALVQLIATPIVRHLINNYGYSKPIVLGTFVLFFASFTFAVGKGYFMLLIARAMQGFSSACISICGMSIIAQIYPEEKLRSQVIGIILGSMALGVLIGYPFGGILYAFCGKSAPFYIISILTLIVLVFQLIYMDLQALKCELDVDSTNYTPFLFDLIVVKIVIAIFISTIAMATLEPCLPIWLMSTLRPEKWQIGIVFIPDSVGYFVSTNFLATLSHHTGSMRMSVVALIIVGISCLLIPYANTISSLVLPHFALGMGIGSLDVALVPLLASIVDSKYAYDDETSSITSNGSSYGGIYAIQQISVSLAYFLGPLLGGEIAQYFSFTWLMLFIGLINISYGIYLMVNVLHMFQTPVCDDKETADSINRFPLRLWPINVIPYYRRFYDTVDMPQH